jgi:hypothetical protein
MISTISKAWRRVLLSTLAAAVAAVLLLPVSAAQAAPRTAPRPAAAAAHAGPEPWLAHLWHGLASLWQTVTDAATGTGGQGGASGSSTTGDAGPSIDPDGHHG